MQLTMRVARSSPGVEAARRLCSTSCSRFRGIRRVGTSKGKPDQTISRERDEQRDEQTQFDADPPGKRARRKKGARRKKSDDGQRRRGDGGEGGGDEKDWDGQ